MEYIRKRILVMLLIISIILSLTGTFFSITNIANIKNIATGSQTAAGTAKVNITEMASVTFNNPNVNFGSGQRKSDVPVGVVCNLTTNGTVPGCWNATDEYSPSDFWIENTGNVNVNVTINSTVSAGFFSSCTGSTTILGGNAAFYWASRSGDGSEDGCLSGYSGSWTEFSGGQQVACSNLTFTDASDSMNISLRLDVPAGPSGICTQEVTLTAMRNY